MAMNPGPKDWMYAVPGSAEEHRLRVQHAAEERAASRTSELAAQVSPAREAEERIRIWERLHALRLPRASSHVLVKVIATQTRLTIGQVHEEQRRRAAPVEPTQAGDPPAPAGDA
jgi:hypothetical protein